MCGRPGRFKGLCKKGGGSIAVMCPALLCGDMTAGPDRFRERHPNNAPACHCRGSRRIVVARRIDRSPSSAALVNHGIGGVAQAAVGRRRYASPRAIMAQMIRAILLARATAANLRGLRSSSCNSHSDADLLPGLA